MLILNNKLLDTRLIFKKSDIKNKKIVADFGCGLNGHITFLSSQIVGAEGKIYAIDILKNVVSNIESIARKGKKINIFPILANLEKFDSLNINQSSIDIVFVINILHQTPLYINVLRNANRIVKKQGCILIIDWKTSAPSFGHLAVNRINQEKITDSLAQIGLRQTDTFDAGSYHYAIVATKL